MDILTAPIKALVNADTCEVYITLSEGFRNLNFMVIVHDGIEFVSSMKLSKLASP